MDSSRQALQTNGKLFSNFEIIVKLTAIFKNISDVGGEAFQFNHALVKWSGINFVSCTRFEVNKKN